MNSKILFAIDDDEALPASVPVMAAPGRRWSPPPAVTGDYGLTAEAIARKLGMVSGRLPRPRVGRDAGARAGR